MRPRAVVMGYHNMGCVGFDALLRHGYEVAAVLTHRDAPGEEIWWESLASRARERGVPVHFPDDPEDARVRDLVASLKVDFIFSFYYRHILPPGVIAVARRGALNLHGSLLPKYRGRAPVNWVLVHGEAETGVSLHYMVAKPDAGDLVDQERVPIAAEDTAFTLFAKLEVAATKLLDRALPALREGTASRTQLDLSQGSYFGRREPDDGRIDWSCSAGSIYDLVRAVTHPYPGAFTTWRGAKLLVWWAVPVARAAHGAPGSVLSVDREGIVVAAGEGAVRLVTVQLAGKPELPACAFAAYCGVTPSNRLDSEGDPS